MHTGWLSESPTDATELPTPSRDDGADTAPLEAGQLEVVGGQRSSSTSMSDVGAVVDVGVFGDVEASPRGVVTRGRRLGLRQAPGSPGRVVPWSGVGTDMAFVVAESAGVCVRPYVKSVTDVVTGVSTAVPIACGSTREAVCRSCAVKARRVRMHQCREGWHRTCELDDQERAEVENEEDEMGDDDLDPGGDGAEVVDVLEDESAPVGRRVRSTRRLAGVPDLPGVPMVDRTTGRTFVDPVSGRTFQPSMFLTLTLPSYGRIVPGTGVPADPDRYDYRRAALDALMWPRLLDRFWQNLRRCAGYKVQYFSAIEAQRRLAPHLHAAVRGAVPRATIKAVTKATYHAVWWPGLDTVVYPSVAGPGRSGVPVWEPDIRGYVDPGTGQVLSSWDQACEQVADPTHVVRFGAQVDIKGLLGGSEDSDRTVRYLCKYLTKNVADTYTGQHSTNGASPAGCVDPTIEDSADSSARRTAAAYEEHTDRLYDEVRLLPCGPGCGNWLRYGVQPQHPGPGLAPGWCPSPAHERENLGLGGRRVLVSRQWSGKTLTQHRADRRAVVAEVLAAAGIDPGEEADADRMAAGRTLPDGSPRYVWSDVDRAHLDYVAVIAASLRQVNRWRQQYERAKTLIACPSGTSPPPVGDRSATDSSRGRQAGQGVR